MYTVDDMIDVGERIAAHGTRHHADALDWLAGAASQVAPGAAAVLADRSAPGIVLERAFAVATGQLVERGDISRR